MPEDASDLLGLFSITPDEAITTYQVQVHGLKDRVSLLQSEVNFSAFLHQPQGDTVQCDNRIASEEQ